jgi:hypothetical protein
MVAFALISGCVIAPSGGGKDYFPYADGNKWEYRLIESLTFLGVTQVDTTTFISEVDGKVALDGEDVWRVIGTDINFDTTYDTTYVYDGADTIKFYMSLQDTTPQVWPLPLEEGKTWIVAIFQTPVTKSSHFLSILVQSRTQLEELTGKGVGVDTIKAEVIAKEGVNVPAGTFADCYKVYISYSAISQFGYYMWVAPGVGIVKFSIESTYMGTTFSTLEELTSYTLH